MSYEDPNIPQIAAPANIDRVIQNIQLTLALKLPWLSNAFGRAYRGVTKGKGPSKRNFHYPEVYKGTGEYYPVSFNDNLDAMCFFEYSGDSDAGDYDSNTHNYLEADLNIVFWVNLKKIDETLGNGYRFTEVLKRDVREVLTRQLFGLDGGLVINSTDDDAEDIFRRYDFDEGKLQYFKYPYAAFSFDTTVTFCEDCNPDLSNTFCDTLKAHLTADEKNTCLLPAYDFSDDDVFNNLTAGQKAELTTRLCP